MDTREEEDDAMGPSHSELQLRKLSCENCRHRKVKCDRMFPCGPCIRKQIKCTYPAGFKPRPKRQRALVSTGYDEKLDAISRKLDDLSLAVRNSGSSSSNQAFHSAAVQTPATQSSHTSQPAEQTTGELGFESPSASELEDDVALITQAAFAADFAQQAVESDHAHPLPLDVTSSLDELRQELREKNEGRKTVNTRPVVITSGAERLQLPPVHIAMGALQLLKKSPRLRFFWIMGLGNINHFVEYFMTVYSGEPSLAEYIIVYCGLERLLTELGNVGEPEERANEYRSWALPCKRNLESVLNRLPFNLPATYDYALALSLAAEFYLTAFQLSTAWRYASAAALMSQTLQLHRDTGPPYNTEEKDRNRYLFWSIYMLERGIAVRLNRSSILRDADITVPKGFPLSQMTDLFPSTITRWIETTRLQGKLYEDIYSPASLALPATVRESRARALVKEFEDVWSDELFEEELANEEFRQIMGPAVYSVFIKAERVSNLSILTLVYRAIPPEPGSGSAFSNECLAAAQECLEIHKECLSLLQQAEARLVELYVQWAVLGSPFVPFVVVFCYALETCDSTHLERLAAVVETLQILPPHLPEAYRKQMRLFSLMYDFACRYIESRSKESQPHSLNTPFNMFFTELGVQYPGDGNMQMYVEAQTGYQSVEQMLPGADADQVGGQYENLGSQEMGVQLGTWLGQSQQIYKMLEEDL